MNFASVAILKSVSATDLVMNRRSFGQIIVPRPGSIVAAPATDLSGGDPDYFFHWLRDSSLVMDALRVLRRGRMSDLARAFDDFVVFSLDLNALNGPARLKQGDIRQGVAPDFLKYVRTDDDLMSVVGDGPLGEVRFNPDGTLDIIRWSRPQNDGPALRALMSLRYFRIGEAFSGQAAVDLARGDLDFIERHWREPCYDLWEEERGHHYYTRLVQMAALDAGAKWMAERGGERHRAKSFLLAAKEIAEQLAEHWTPGQCFYLSRLGDDPTDPRRCLDASIILAAIHADREDGPHSVLDPRMQATVEKLEALFKAEYHRTRDATADTRGPAMGRYADDAYAPGAAWYITTLAAAEFHYRIADRLAKGHRLACTAENASFLTRILGLEPSPGSLPSSIPEARMLAHAFVKRGDAFMATIRDVTPASGELSEQFDPSSGRQKSAKNLAWSYAAFITACNARDEAARAADSG